MFTTSLYKICAFSTPFQKGLFADLHFSTVGNSRKNKLSRDASQRLKIQGAGFGIVSGQLAIDGKTYSVFGTASGSKHNIAFLQDPNNPQCRIICKRLRPEFLHESETMALNWHSFLESEGFSVVSVYNKSSVNSDKRWIAEYVPHPLDLKIDRDRRLGVSLLVKYVSILKRLNAEHKPILNFSDFHPSNIRYSVKDDPIGSYKLIDFREQSPDEEDELPLFANTMINQWKFHSNELDELQSATTGTWFEKNVSWDYLFRESLSRDEKSRLILMPKRAKPN